MSDRDVSERKFFMHAAHQTVGVSRGLAALEGYDPKRFTVGSKREKARGQLRPRVCLVSGSSQYKSDESLLKLQAYLESNSPAEFTWAFAESKRGLPGLRHIDRCDCLLLFVQRIEIENESLERIRAYCRRGGSIVAVRTDGHGLKNWPSMDREVLGGDYQGQYDNREAGVMPVVTAREHPVLTGVKPFVARGTLYKNRCLAPDAQVLLTGSFCDHSHPVAWARPNQNGRVFCTSLGHPDDFREPDFLRLLTNAILWTARQKSSK